MKTTFEIWVAVGADGYKACIGSGLTLDQARSEADKVHFTGGEAYTLCKVEAEVPLPEEKQISGPVLSMRAK